MNKLFSLRPVFAALPACGLVVALVPADLLAQTGCVSTNGQNCQISASGGTGGHGQTGGAPSPNPIVHDVAGSQALSAGNGAGAIDFASRGGNGGDANSHGQNGGGGAGGGAIGSLTVGTGVTAQGANGGGVTRFVSQGGNGGGGDGAIRGTRGRGGQGGSGGPVTVDFEGVISTQDAGSPGLVVSTTGGTGGSGNSGGVDFFGAFAGNGGDAGAIDLQVSRTVATAGTGVQASAAGGSGGRGPDDTAGASESIASDGGRGGSSRQTMQVSVSGTVTSSQLDGVDVQASGGRGGDGGTSGPASVSQGGNGGSGGTGGPVNVTVSGRVQSARASVSVSSGGGAGGDGGQSLGTFAASGTKGGDGGAGGNGGTAGAVVASGGQVAGGVVGVSASVTGGAGGNGGTAAGSAVQGGGGAQGGNGGTATVDVAGTTGGSPGAAATGASATANGGAGGSGAGSGGSSASGGHGGNGGSGGNATATLRSGGTVTTSAVDAPRTTVLVLPGMLVQANGGVGGAGGVADAPLGASGGGAGFGGAGGTATAVVDGSVSTGGSFAHGVLAQSAGGMGGGGGNARSLFMAHGGKALNGGSAGTVIVSGSGGTIATTGTGAIGLLGQSIGGGGGTGGNALAVVGGVIAIGGNGGAGGDGGAVKVGQIASDASTSVLQDTVITRGDVASGIFAQSVGGAGGNGGNAIAADLLPLALTIGGDGKGGGTGGNVQAHNDGLVTTFGAHSAGIVAQSVGGGGGNGGAGISVDASLNLAVAVSIGGTGAGGGSGGTVDLVNSQQVITYGSDSYGLKAQSIAGGGGSGGTTLDLAAAYSDNPEYPSASVSVGIGGKGGAGGNQSASPVSIANSGFVSTAGAGSFGVFAQSVAGGGGNGGDSSASSYAKGKNLNISVSLGIAGDGGASGTGGPVTLDNSGLVATYGETAHGLMAQSIGGGGGVGGIGDAAADTSETDKFGLSGSASVGGKGGKGSQGGLVVLTNSGSVATQADGSRGLLAQSVGGGGGASGGGAAKANAQDLALSISVGGNAGSGGNGGEVRVTNTGSVLTQGADADGVYAQSVGGGGGVAGKGSSTAGGGNEPHEVAEAMLTTLANGLNLGKGTTKVADGVYQLVDGEWKDVKQLNDLRKLLQPALGVAPRAGVADPAPDKKDGEAKSIDLDVTVGGAGGAGGDGGKVGVDNSASIETQGARSNGVFAQSIGGGGGVGGVSSFSTAIDDKGGSLSMGGNGAAAGNGGDVNVSHQAGASITTGGAVAHGIFAQSVGGGGGKGGLTGSEQGALRNLNIILGGAGAAGGTGGDVTVDVAGTIATSGEQAFGVLAQSAGGGGGTADVLTDGKAGSPDKNIALQLNIGGKGGTGGTGGAATVRLGGTQGASVTTQGDDGIGIVTQSIGGGGGVFVTSSILAGHSLGLGGYTMPVSIGGKGGSSGNGGSATVSLGTDAGSNPTPFVVTHGRDAYGVLAQSIGGGGGIVAGTADAKADISALFASTEQKGNGGTVAVTLDNSAWIYTSGAGSVGVLAQSIGGGGGLIGGMSKADVTAGLSTAPIAEGGQGGNVTVDLQRGGNIVTTGARAHGVFAQSGGGGAGVLAQADGQGRAFSASPPYAACGDACTGSVNVTLGANTVVRASGADAWGIVVQSRGNGVNDTSINIGAGGYVESWKDSAGAIFVDGAGNNRIVNAGTIDDGTATNGGVRSTSGVAIAGNRAVTIENSGVLNGDIRLPTGASRLENLPGGSFNAGATVDLGAQGQLRNRGTLKVGGGAIAQTRLRGDLVQEAGGRMVFDVDSAARRGDTLNVEGSARLGGTLVLRSATLAPQAVTVLRSGTGAAAPDVRSLSVVDSGGGQLFGYTPSVSGGALSVLPYAKLDSAAATAGFGANRQAVAAHLQAGFAPGLSAQQGAVYAQVASLPSTAHYASALDSLSGEALQGGGAARLSASLAFTERMQTSWCDAPGSLGGRGDRGDLPRETECTWARLIGNDTKRSANRDSMGYDANDTTLQAGAQRRLSEDWFVGGSLSYDRSSLGDNAGLGRVHGDSSSAGLVLKREAGPWLVSGAVDVGFGRYDSERTIAFAQTRAVAKGDFDMWHAGLHSRIAYRMPYAGFYLQPYIDLHAVHVRTGRYSETGAGSLGLNVDKASDTFYSASPMLEIGGRTTLGNGMELRSFVGVGATLNSDTDWGANARLSGWGNSSAPFNATAMVPRRQARLNVGANLALRQNLEVGVEFIGSQAKGFRSRSGALRVNYRF